MALFIEFLTQQWILVAALLSTAALLVFHESRKAGPSATPQQAINLVNKDQGVFLDLRDAGEFGEGHIAESLHIPSTKMASRLAELEKYKDRPIVLVCKMGQTSGGVAKQLRAAGYDRVYRMTGGMMEWTNLQLPIVK